MNRYATLHAAAFLCFIALPAHAVSNPDSAVNGINSAFRSSTVTPKAVGGGGGGGGGTRPTEICNGSPENATVLLALLSGAGLLAGRQMRRLRVARVAIS